jgi:signal transduction histidine kinase
MRSAIKPSSRSTRHLTLRRQPRLERARADARAAQAVELAVTRALAAERARVAQDLHDGLGGTLSALAHSTDAQTATLAVAALRNMRALLANQCAAPFAERFADVRAAIATQCELMSVEFYSEAIGLESAAAQSLSANLISELLHIIREAACNALKHSGCDSLALQVCLTPQTLQFTVSDDGCGMKNHSARASGEACVGCHLGLSGMQARAERIGALLEVHSGAGTRVSLALALGNVSKAPTSSCG